MISVATIMLRALPARKRALLSQTAHAEAQQALAAQMQFVWITMVTQAIAAQAPRQQRRRSHALHRPTRNARALHRRCALLRVVADRTATCQWEATSHARMMALESAQAVLVMLRPPHPLPHLHRVLPPHHPHLRQPPLQQRRRPHQLAAATPLPAAAAPPAPPRRRAPTRTTAQATST
jgi:hypothetical protein